MKEKVRLIQDDCLVKRKQTKKNPKIKEYPKQLPSLCDGLSHYAIEMFVRYFHFSAPELISQGGTDDDNAAGALKCYHWSKYSRRYLLRFVGEVFDQDCLHRAGRSCAQHLLARRIVRIGVVPERFLAI